MHWSAYKRKRPNQIDEPAMKWRAGSPDLGLIEDIYDVLARISFGLERNQTI